MILGDLRVALRRLRRTPAFTTSAFVTLVLGLGALVTIYTVLDSVVLEDLAYQRADDLVDVYSSVPGLGFERWEVTEGAYVHFSENVTTLDAVGAYRVGSATVGGEDGARRIAAAQITPSLLTVLSAGVAVGRPFAASDGAPGGARIAMLHHDYWAAEFGANTAAVGSSIQALGVEWEVVGVLEPGFDLPEDHADLWLPLRTDAAEPDADSHSLRVIGRRANRAPLVSVQEELARLTARFPDRFPEDYTATWMEEAGFRTVVQSLSTKVVDARVRRVLWTLFGGSMVILLIACVNVFNLFLVRNVDRRRELAVRRALGAARTAILRHFVAEALLMTLAAATVALVLAEFALVPLRQFGGNALPRLDAVGVDGSVAGLALFVALITGLVLGSLPALSSERAGREAMTAVRSRATGTRRQHWVRGALVAAQLALALTLLNGSGLLVRSFRQLLRVDPGFRSHGVVAVDLSLTGTRYRDQSSVDGFYREVLAGVRAIPGVREAGAVTSLPLETGLGCYSLAVESRPLTRGEPDPCIDVYVATSGYFDAMAFSRATGRWFSDADNVRPTGATVVTRALADQMWSDRSPLGQGLSIHGYREPWLRVVGVTGSLHANGLDAPPAAAVFLPMVTPEGAREFLGHRGGMTLVARTDLADPMGLVPAMRRVIATVDPAVAAANPRLVDDVVAASRSDIALAALLLGLSAGVALILGTIGLYGVMAHNLSSRVPEIGVRVALGASRNAVRHLVMRTALAPIAVGVGAGALAATASAGALQSLVFGIEPVDPPTLVAVAGLLAGAGAVAALVVARRATHLNLIEALRAE